MTYDTFLLGFFSLGTTEIVVIALVALLVFGSRLPHVGRSLGKGIVEFKKGLRGIQDEIDGAGQSNKDSNSNDPQS